MINRKLDSCGHPGYFKLLTTIKRMAVESSSNRPVSEISLSGDELFDSFMDIAASLEESKLCESKPHVFSKDSLSAVCTLTDLHHKDSSDEGKLTLTQSDKQDSLCFDENLDTDKNSALSSNQNISVSAVITETLVANYVSDDSCILSTSDTGDISTVESRDCSVVRDEDETNTNNKDLTLLSSVTEIESTLQCAVKSESNTLFITKEQGVSVNERLAKDHVDENKMDITLNGVTFSWEPSKGVEYQQTSKCNCKDQRGNEQSLPDVVCSCCQNGLAKPQDLPDGTKHSNETSISTNDKTLSASGVKEMYYDSPRESVRYDSVNIQRCIDIIDERFTTSSLERDENRSLEPNASSTFYYEIDREESPPLKSTTENCINNGKSLKPEQNGGASLENIYDKTETESTPMSKVHLPDSDEDVKKPRQSNGCRRSSSTASSASERDYMENYNLMQLGKSDDVEKCTVLYSGSLTKLGGTGLTPKNWRRRWFELKSDNCLYYYRNQKDKTPAGAIILANYLITNGVDVGRKFCFKLTKGGARSYCMAAESDSEMKSWMKVLSEASKAAWDDRSHIPESNIKNVSIPALSIKDPDCHGYLWKQGFTHKSWKRRYCVLKSGCLYYYEDMSEPVAIGVFKLHRYDIQETELTGRKWSIVAIAPDPRMRTFYFSSDTELDFNRWLVALRKSVSLIKRPSCSS